MIYNEYIDLYKKYTQKYGSKTAIFIMVGSFYELYDTQHKHTGETQTNICEIADFLGIQISIKKSAKLPLDIDIIFAKLLVSKISKNASRQGTKDEIFILDKCNETTKKIGIKIEKLSQIAYRPSKLGKILNHKEVKKAKLNKIDCLKSFDGKISGKCNGWIFSKIVFTAGGHQDNVFEEAYQLCEWVETFEKKDKTLYALIIDTDLEKSLNDLRNKYKNNKNIFIGNH